MHRLALALILLCRAGYAQETSVAAEPQAPLGHETEHDAKLPNGRSRGEALLKQDYAHSLKDAAALTDLAQSLQADLAKDGRDVLSLQTLKKLDEIEKLTHRIRARMRRY